MDRRILLIIRSRHSLLPSPLPRLQLLQPSTIFSLGLICLHALHPKSRGCLWFAPRGSCSNSDRAQGIGEHSLLPASEAGRLCGAGEDEAL